MRRTAQRPEFPAAWTSLHAALMSLAYGAFGLSAVAALMYLTQERNLKFHKLQAIFSLCRPSSGSKPWPDGCSSAASFC